jgi:hypothetical protein
MIGSDILLFPEAGEGFLSTLRAAVLYSERVRVLRLVPSAVFANIIQHGKADSAPRKFERARKYLTPLRHAVQTWTCSGMKDCCRRF